jgi:NADPH2 dehydrogenase
MGSITPAKTSSTLFEPLTIGSTTLAHRIALAPLTRFRATDEHVPITSLVGQYYNQRAAVPGTLLITEATFIAPQAGGTPNVPGIYSTDQINAWKKVTEGVHANGSKIFLQLWALGRAASADQLKKEFGDKARVVSASDIPFEGGSKPSPLSEDEVREYVKLYAQAAKNAIEAGFDGVEIHGANGYLLDQFTQDVSNQRTDAYGGSIEKRARFPLEVAKAVADAVGADRVGYRISPFSEFQGMRMKEPLPQFKYLVQGLKELDLAFLHLVEARITGNDDNPSSERITSLVEQWTDGGKTAFVAGGYKADNVNEVVDEMYKGRNVGVVFGRYFISNPDLVFRLKEGIKLEPYDRSLFYNAGEAKGYVTYPFSKEFQEILEKKGEVKV